MPTAYNSGPSLWIKGAAWILGLFLPLFAAGVFSIYSIQRDHDERQYRDLRTHLGRVDGTISGLLTSVARVNEHVTSHNKEAGYWKTRIEKNSVRLEELATDASARPDSFTGTQGREMDHRLDKMERNVDELTWVIERLRALEEKILGVEP